MPAPARRRGIPRRHGCGCARTRRGETRDFPGKKDATGPFPMEWGPVASCRQMDETFMKRRRGVGETGLQAISISAQRCPVHAPNFGEAAGHSSARTAIGTLQTTCPNGKAVSETANAGTAGVPECDDCEDDPSRNCRVGLTFYKLPGECANPPRHSGCPEIENDQQSPRVTAAGGGMPRHHPAGAAHAGRESIDISARWASLRRRGDHIAARHGG